MAITFSLVADSAEELAEPLRKVAVQKDGKFVVQQLPEGFAIEDVNGLKTTLTKLRSELNETKGMVKAFQDAGLTHEEAKTASDALQKMKAGTLKSTDELDKWKQSVEAKFAADRQKDADRLAKRTDRLRNELVRGKLAPIIAAKGGADAMDAILTLAERNIRVEEDAEGNLNPVVVGSDGKTAAVTKKVGSMDPMGFDELIDTMRESPVTKGLFRVSASGGSGATSQAAGGGRMANQGQTPALSSRELFDRANATAK